MDLPRPRIRRSLHTLEDEWRAVPDGTVTELDTLIRAFWGIQNLPPDNENSFFRIAGYHGEPFQGKGVKEGKWWGGYCNHHNVLFPTWHRAYLLRLEDALRSIPGCQDVTLPFLDECLFLTARFSALLGPPDEVSILPGLPIPKPPVFPDGPYIPRILTMPTVLLKGENIEIPNPLYSYRLQKPLDYQIDGADQRYSKPVGYETVRYPLSGLVGNPEDKKKTVKHNEIYSAKSTSTLNQNVGAWLEGRGVVLDDGNPGTERPSDTTSVYSRFLNCLKAPNYTVFSNRKSETAWNNQPSRVMAMSLESPHDAIHLAVGGFYQAGVYNADPILGANGDMGANEMAGFDPIFYFHHCFIDYVFWQWQKRHGLTEKGSLQIDYDIGTGEAKGAGTKVVPGEAGYPLGDDEPEGTKLTMDTPLYPYKTPQGAYYTSHDVTNIADLGYEYGIGSLDVPLERKPEIRPWVPLIGESGAVDRSIALKMLVTGINRADYPGSFVIRTFSMLPSGKEVEVGREPILSRWHVGNCANCRDKLEAESVVAIDHAMLGHLEGGNQDREIEFRVKIQKFDEIFETQYPSRRRLDLPFAPPGGPPEPIIKSIFKLSGAS
ncbi:Di-copper centre-containing protein [Terfezia boudieri ATCC MYA-4762]|uniref:tyrosinase n=1 Tax=Terfezia boudieri ATCC MYA-4762 TaxID=1051890 RepID=A0A3N4LQ83_9PEZI|nr:Di-copper centre-containing protein [Terfezia boudieri ATCC MYA-4762]